MKKHFLLMLLLTLLPLAGWATNYTVKIGAKAANIQFGEGTPTTATPAMFMVLDWDGIDDELKTTISDEIASNLSVTSERVAGSPLGNYAFTLSVTAPGYQQIGTSEDYYRVLVEDGSSSGTFKQVKNDGAPYLTSGVKATSLTYTTGEEQSLLSTLPDAFFAVGGDYAEALVKGLPVEFQVVNEEDEVVSDWSTSEPKATDAGTYKVKYRAKEDTRYTFYDNSVTLDGIQIAKGTPEITTAPTFAENTTFVAGTPVNLITNPGEATLDASMIFRYRKVGGSWSKWYSYDYNGFTRSDAGTFIIQYNTLSTSNLNPAMPDPESVEIVIAKADIKPDQFTAPTAADLTYSGDEQALVEGAAATEIDGTFTYATSEDGEAWSEFVADVPTGKNAKSYFVKYKFTPTANYNAYEAVVENVAIAPLSIVDGEGNLAAGFTLSAANMEAANASVFTGKAIEPTVALRYKGSSMSHSVLAGGDYARSYNNNINASDEAEIIFTAKNNFTGEYTQKFTINPAQIGAIDVTVTSMPPYVYTGKAIEPVGTAKLITGNIEYTLTENDYELSFEHNVNVGQATATISAKQGGNFTGEPMQLNFDIVKKNLIVKVANATKSFSQVDPTPVIESIDGFVEGEDVNSLPANAYTINRADGADPGTYAYDVVDNGVVGCNYSFADADPQGALTIKAATVIVRATAVEDIYGDYIVPGLDQSGFAFTAEGLKAGHIINALTFTVTNEQGEEQAFDTMLPAGTYTITPSNAGTNAGSYTFDYQTATLTIAKRDLTLTAEDQIIEYGNSANTNVEFEGDDKTVDVVGRVGDDELGTITINVAAETTSIGTHDDAITLSVEGENANYNYTLVAGNLTITAPAEFVFDKTDGDVWDKIKDYDGQTKDVTVKLYGDHNIGSKTYSWKAYEWNTLILPFEVTVKELSAAIGYAIVNTYNVENTKESNADFKLTMGTIPANTPFLVKTADDIDTYDLTFENKEIVAPAESTVTLTAANGISFIGTYENVTIDKITSQGQGDPATYYKYYAENAIKGIGANSDNAYPVFPFGAFFNWTAPVAGVHAFSITTEDLNGEATSISSVESDENASAVVAEGWYTLNGVKLNGAPTQKGIYINNGKKVVIR